MARDAFVLLPTNRDFIEKFNTLFIERFNQEQRTANYYASYHELFTTLNKYIEEPPSLRRRQQATFNAQEAYNRYVERAQQEAKHLDDPFSGKRKIIAQLAQARTKYNNQQARYRNRQNKIQTIKTFNPESDRDTWSQLKELCFNQAGKPQRLKKLREIRESWQAQANMAWFDTRDLIEFETALAQCQVDLDALLIAVNAKRAKVSPEQEKSIRLFVAQNKSQIQLYQDRIKKAYGWRMEGGSLAKQIRCGDALLALKLKLRKEVFNDIEDPAGVISATIDGLIPLKGYESDEITLDEFVFLQNKVMCSGDPDLKNIWLSSWWGEYRENDLIPMIKKGDVILPHAMAEQVPNKMGYRLGTFIRYYFFRTADKINRLGSWLRYWIVGNYPQTALLINETNRLLTGLVANFKEAESKDSKQINFSALGKSYAFRAALEIYHYLEQEEIRSNHIKPAWFFGVFLRYIPIINRAMTYQFYENWFAILSKGKSVIKSQCQEIIPVILRDFSKVLINGLQSNQFAISKGFIRDLKEFVKRYGTPIDIDLLGEVLDPLMIVDLALQMGVTPEVCDALDHYASINWSEPHQNALPDLVQLISGESLPSSEADENQRLFSAIRVFLHEPPEAYFKHYLRHVACKFIYPRGDNFNDNTLAFLKRHAPDKAEIWEKERSSKLDRLYTDFKTIFEETPEKDFVFIQSKGCHPDVFRKLQVHQDYQAALTSLVEAYVTKYDGSNLRYLSYIQLTDDKAIQTYVLKRIQWIAQCKEVTENTLDDTFLSALISKRTDLKDTVRQWVYDDYKGDHQNSHAFIASLNEPDITANYFIKYCVSLINNNDYQSLLSTLASYEHLLSNNLQFKKQLSSILVECFEKKPDQIESADPVFIDILDRVSEDNLRDAYFCLRIKQALQTDNVDDALSLIQICRESSTNQWLKTTAGKQKLIKIYEEMQQQAHGWHYLLQAFMETDLPSYDKSFLYEIRKQWLEEFLTFPEKYTNESIHFQSWLFQQYHQRNLEIPSDYHTLTSYFGDDCLHILHAKFDNLLNPQTKLISDLGLQLIDRYLSTDEMRALDNNVLLQEKVLTYQTLKRFYYQIDNEYYPEALEILESEVADISAIQSLIGQTTENSRREYLLKKLAYKKACFENMVSGFKDMVKTLKIHVSVIREHDLETYHILEKNNVEKCKRIQLLLTNCRNLSPAIKQEVHEILTAPITKEMLDLTRQFTISQLETLSLNASALRDLFKVISKSCRQEVLKKIDDLLKLIPSEDPCKENIEVFKALFAIEDPNSEAFSTALNSLSEIQMTPSLLANWKQQWTRRVIGYVNDSGDLTELPLFSNAAQQNNDNFSRYIDPNQLDQLASSLYQRINLLVTHKLQVQNVNVAKNITFYKNLLDWCHQKRPQPHLHDNFLHDLSGIENNTQKLIEQLQIKLQEISSYIVDDKPHDIITMSQAEKNALLQNAMILSVFGDSAQKTKFNQELTRIWYGITDYFLDKKFLDRYEHMVDMVAQLIIRSGDDALRESCQLTMDLLNRYRSKRSNSTLTTVQAEKYIKAIDHYINTLDKSAYQYFIDKFHMRPEFLTCMQNREKIREDCDAQHWHEGLCHIQKLDTIFNQTKSTWLNFLTQHATNQNTLHKLIYSPTERDAKKLFVAFVLVDQAHFLAEFWRSAFSGASPALCPLKIEDLSSQLLNTLASLRKAFKIGQHDFNKNLISAVQQTSGVFVSWSPDETRHAVQDFFDNVGLAVGYR